MRDCGLFGYTFKLDRKIKKAEKRDQKRKNFTIRTRLSNWIPILKQLIY